MTFVLAWVLLPLVLGLLSLGCGLLVETLSATRLPGALLIPVGFAAVVVIAQLATLSSATARLATPAVVGCAIVGLVLAFPLRRPNWWPALAGAGGYAAYAAPVAASGQATFAGYIKLDDTATYLAMLDRVVDEGRSLAGLAPSTYEATLATSLDYGYPLGSFVPLGVGSTLLGTDPAWLWQPYLAFLGGLLAIGLYSLLPAALGPRPLLVAAAILAAQPALLFGYSLWGGIKELAAAALLAAAAAAFVWALRAPSAWAVVAPAVVCAALVGALSVGGAAWLGPLALGAAALAVLFLGLRESLARAGVFAAAMLVFAVPAIVAAFEWLPRTGDFASEGNLGNLIGRLRLVQAFGIWPIGDFRRAPSDLAPVYVLIAVVAVAAIVGLAWAVVGRRWAILLFAGATPAGSAALLVAGSPWVGGKAIAVASPAILFLAVLGCLAAAEHGHHIEAGVAAAAILTGVVWSNGLAYRDVWLAPSSRLAELERIGERFAGQGPALMTEFEPYGARHFLRHLDPEGASELRRRFVNLRSGQPLAPQAYADIDRVQLSELLVYRTLVLRRSPVSSRPPMVYQLVERGRWYEVWQRAEPPKPRILEHLPLGTERDPAAVPPCRDVLRLAGLSGVQRLAALTRGPVVVVPLDSLALSGDWTPAIEAGSLTPRRSGTGRGSVRLPRAGRWSVWAGGSFVGKVSVTVDGATIGSGRHQLEWAGQFVGFGLGRLGAGAHEVELYYDASGWRPGTRGVAPFGVGPIVFALETQDFIATVPPAEARTLCGLRLDWVEAVGG